MKRNAKKKSFWWLKIRTTISVIHHYTTIVLDKHTKEPNHNFDAALSIRKSNLYLFHISTELPSVNSKAFSFPALL